MRAINRISLWICHEKTTGFGDTCWVSYFDDSKNLVQHALSETCFYGYGRNHLCNVGMFNDLRGRFVQVTMVCWFHPYLTGFNPLFGCSLQTSAHRLRAKHILSQKDRLAWVVFNMLHMRRIHKHYIIHIYIYTSNLTIRTIDFNRNCISPPWSPLGPWPLATRRHVSWPWCQQVDPQGKQTRGRTEEMTVNSMKIQKIYV